MQNLPVITSTPPVAAVQPSTSADNNSATQAAEPFGNVLARQRAASTSAAPGGAQSGKPGSSSSLSRDTAPAANGKDAVANGKDAADGSQVLDTTNVTDTAATDLQTALLLDVTATDKLAASDKADPKADSKADSKADPQASAPDGASTLPGDMLAMLLPTTTGKGGAGKGEVAGKGVKAGLAANEKDIRETALGAGKEVQAQQMAALIPGEVRQTIASGKARQAAENKVSPQALVASGDMKPAQLRLQADGKPVSASAINTGKEKAFAAALEVSVKDGAKAAQLDANLAKAHMQPGTPAAMDGMSQNSALSAVTSQNGVAQAAQAAINTPLTHEAWGDEFSQKITWMATQHEQTAALHLNPPNLGPLDVVIKVHGDQATALFTSPHAAVRDVVEQALPRLRDMMADNGITLGNAMVSDQSPKDQQAWQASTQQRNGGSSREVDVGVSIGAVSSGSAPLGRRHNGMVDTFV